MSIFFNLWCILWRLPSARDAVSGFDAVSDSLAPMGGDAAALSHGTSAAPVDCDRYLAAYQPGSHAGHHHNYQLPLLALALVLISGGAIQHFFSRVPLPYTVLLLIFGVARSNPALGSWRLWPLPLRKGVGLSRETKKKNMSPEDTM